MLYQLEQKVVLKPGFGVTSVEEIGVHAWTEIDYGNINENMDTYYAVASNNNTFATVWNPETESTYAL